jgi:xanthine dehydrogenase iron-sulfur cluster and FAD-binding subunit A
MKLKFILLVLVSLASLPLFAFGANDINITDPAQFVILLMPAVTWLATEAAKIITKTLGGNLAGTWVLGLVVPALSALGAYILTLVVPEASFLVALLLGLGSTFIDQVIRKMQGN